MKKITTLKEVHDMFELLNIQRCDTNAQRKRGTSVYKLPHDLCYPNGRTIPVKFAEYASGYVRRVEAGYTCWQINKTRKSDEYFKDYEWNEDYTKQTWTGKYRKSNRTIRILIPRYEDRMIHMANHILKNHYQMKAGGKTKYVIGEWTKDCMVANAKKKDKEDWKKYMECDSEQTAQCVKPGLCFQSSKDEIAVIINGHRYNLA